MKDQNHTENEIVYSDLSEESNDNYLNPLQFDPDNYREDIAAFEYTEEQQNKLLQTLWHIMSAFVDLGYGVDTVQMFLPELFEKAGRDSGKLLQQKDVNTFNEAALTHAAGKEENHDG